MYQPPQPYRPGLRLDVQQHHLKTERENHAAMAAGIRGERESLFAALVRAFRGLVPGIRRMEPAPDTAAPRLANVAEKS